MNVKVASVCLSDEKEWREGKLYYHYAYPDMAVAQVFEVGNYFTRLAVAMVEQAAGQGAQIVCFPENTVNIARWLRGPRTPAERLEAVRRCADAHIEALCEAAGRCGVVVIGGTPQADGDHLFNTAPVIDERGNLLGSYRKVHLAEGEDRVLTAGEDFPVFETRYGRIGVFICWDIYFPETTQVLSLKGAQLLFQPTYGHSGKIADAMAQVRAFDAVCPLVVAMWDGQGRIFDRDGRLLARAEYARDWQGIIPHQILYAEVDPAAPRPGPGRDDIRPVLQRQRQWQAYTPLVHPPPTNPSPDALGPR